ncbi:MAG: molybdate ABC transporter permease subunit [Halobacteriovoraceae bacterium]|jgi:molybdate transport system permease protein|nr:molybdate ABC transporter permease subunit [Halobacteriovoraceae bacterium]
MDYTAVWLTLKLALVSTIILMLIGVPLAWWLARGESFLRTLVGTLVSVPLVLPPSILGFYLLVTMGSDGFIGQMTTSLGLGSFAFTFQGLVIGSVIYSIPFVVGPIQSTFESIDQKILQASYTLGATPLVTFRNIVLPLSWHGLVTSMILGFAHTIGEFGVVLMIGGNIPGETQVLSVLIYDHVEALEYQQAHMMSFILLVFSFLILLPMYITRKKTKIRYV